MQGEAIQEILKKAWNLKTVYTSTEANPEHQPNLNDTDAHLSRPNQERKRNKNKAHNKIEDPQISRNTFSQTSRKSHKTKPSTA